MGACLCVLVCVLVCDSCIEDLSSKTPQGLQAQVSTAQCASVCVCVVCEIVYESVFVCACMGLLCMCVCVCVHLLCLCVPSFGWALHEFEQCCKHSCCAIDFH